MSALADRRPAAVATWLQGEREYRSFNFARALEFERRAVKEDSALAIAAIRGAQAANWLNEAAEAGALADVALRRVSLLPERMAPFARGLHAYLNGRADSAVIWLKHALRASPEWTEAHMSLGEVYYHLLPPVRRPLDSLAQAEFTAAALDSGFSPPRFHLAEMAIRSGDTIRAKAGRERISSGWPRTRPAVTAATSWALMLPLRQGRPRRLWSGGKVGDAPLNVLAAAKLYAAGGAFPGCAEAGYRTVFNARDSIAGRSLGCVPGIAGSSWAEGRVSEVRATVDSALAHGLDSRPSSSCWMRLAVWASTRKRRRSRPLDRRSRGIFVRAAAGGRVVRPRSGNRAGDEVGP